MTTKIKAVPFARERKRSSITTVSSHFSDVVTRISTGEQTVYGNSTQTINLQNWEIMDDWVTPGFAAKQARGEIVASPMSSVKTSYEVGGTGSMAHYVNGDWMEDYGRSDAALVALYGMPSLSPNTVDIESLVSYCKTNALSKCRSSSLQGLVSLAEMGKTINMLKHPLDSISSLLAFIHQQRTAKKNLRVEKRNGEVRFINGRPVPTSQRRRHTGPGRVVRKSKETLVIPISETISSSVLVNNLGLRPLLMDIDAVLNQIPNAHKEERLTFRSTAEDKSVNVENNVLGVGGFSVNAMTTTTHVVKVRSSVMILDQFNVSQDFGISLYDLPEAAWELVPYSFVLDYVVNVGDFLGALRALATQNILTASTVYTVDSIASREVTSATPSPNWTIVTMPSGKDVVTINTKVRSIGIGVPSGVVVLPSAKMVTPTHIQNTLSLIVQQLIGIRNGPPTLAKNMR